MSPKTTRRFDLVGLRQECRQILIEQGTPLAHTANTPEGVDELYCELAERNGRIVVARNNLEARIERKAGRALMVDVSNFFGTVMAGYGDAGFFVGLAMGLELAALTFGQLATAPVVRRRQSRKPGPRR